MSEEIQLRGHVHAVVALVTVPSDDGRSLLVSGDAGGSARVWDPWTGELLAGPVTLDGMMVTNLAVLQLGSGKRALLSSGMRGGLRLWHPSSLAEAGPLPRRLRNCGLAAFLPGTSETPELLVTQDRKAISVTDPASGRTLFKRRHGGFIRGYGNQFESAAGLLLEDGTPGLAAARLDGAVEVWAAVRGRRWKRRHHWVSPHISPGCAMTFLSGERGEPLLATAAGRGVEVWDLRTGRCTLRADLDMVCTALAPVPLGDRTVLAAGGEGRTGGVQLWDPSTGRTLGPLFNGHGPSTVGQAPKVRALAVVQGPDGTVRVASAGSDAVVRVSPPFTGPDDTPPEQLPVLPQRAEQQHEQPPGERRGHAYVHNRSGTVPGLSPSGLGQDGRGDGQAACTGCDRTAREADPVPTCPACGKEDHEFVARAVAKRVLRDGALTAPCLGCRQVTFVFEPDMVCVPCRRLRPDLNQRLRERFAEQGPGSSEGMACIGCGFGHRIPRMAQVVACPHCAEDLAIGQDDCPRQGMVLSCPSCGGAVRIPSTVWCPDCGLNFRRTGMAELVREANA